MKRLVKVLLIWPVLFTVYLLYTGSLSLYTILTGLFASFVITLLVADLLVENVDKLFQPRRLWELLKFIVRYFLVDEVKSHLLVIKLALSPRLDLKPAIVKVPIKSRSDYAITMISLAITNTPGTLVVDISSKRDALYVHWIYAIKIEPEEAYKAICEGFDQYAHRVFD